MCHTPAPLLPTSSDMHEYLSTQASPTPLPSFKLQQHLHEAESFRQTPPPFPPSPPPFPAPFFSCRCCLCWITLSKAAPAPLVALLLRQSSTTPGKAADHPAHPPTRPHPYPPPSFLFQTSESLNIVVDVMENSHMVTVRAHNL